MIVSLHVYVAFLAAGVALNLTPGPDMLYVLASGSRAGPRSGVLAACGVGAGCAVHTFAAATGLSALLVSSATAFTAVKWAGAAYLVYLGGKALLAPAALAATPAPGARAEAGPAERVFRRAVVTNVLNPKVAIFFLAFVPQFVDPARGRIWLQFLVLGLSFCVTGTLVNAVVGVAAGKVRRTMDARPRVARALDRITGAVFLGLGLRLVFAPRS
ncbi:LysE family translocator [Anaeromyxobacter paludicola]|uniref:Lysine transporter LysE n=1 Tax=Anaeromyxobacter paludicola TaxID=2918171 RepID=A0ABN6N9C2_9BACT|nr:LysE family translocator [Anaeromyxobacter paludicola]BDG09834.1 lysine transporter LysE [Anaeromyxobacter paludicola]